MILLRELKIDDLDTLERFSQIPGFINLPNDRDLLKEKILRSTASFTDRITNKNDAKYIFAAQDLESGRVVGTSMIAARHGSEESPHFYFEVGSEQKFSTTINTGFIHGTLKLKYDTDGPSEIGGLVIDPEIRNSDARVGRQISFVRFLFLGLHRARFKRKIIAELLPPLNIKGLSPLWEAVGRRFTNMDYWEADHLCQKSKEFIFSLFPSGKIYTTFLSAEARSAIGKVGRETEPVLHMLNKIGFVYKNQVDPFDGGPHLWANVEDLMPVKKIAQGVYEGVSSAAGGPFDSGLLSKIEHSVGTFRAVAVHARIEGQRIFLSNESDCGGVEHALGLARGDAIAFMPYY